MDLYKKIKEQRSTFIAPVDTIGCASMGNEYDDETKKFYVLVGLLFSSQTKDQITYEAVMNLTKLLDVMTPDKILKADKESIHNCIKKVGYHNKKIEYLLEIAKRVRHGMPTEYKEVLKLPGLEKRWQFYTCTMLVTKLKVFQ